MNARNMKASDLQTIEHAFRMLKEIHFSKTGTDMIAETLKQCLGDSFHVTVVPQENQTQMFVMSIFPARSTVDKIIESVTSGKTSFETIQSLWEKNNSWTLEIDEMILGTPESGATPRELTALILHEIGHVMYSKSVATRIVTILQYEYAQTKMANKLLLRDRVFRSIMSIPILNSCVSDQSKKGSLKEEIVADTFVKKMGYTRDLISVMNQLLSDKRYPQGDNNRDENMRTATKFSINTIDNLRERRNELVKRRLLTMKESVRSPYFESVLADIYGTWFVDKTALPNICYMENSNRENEKQKYLERFMERASNEYMKEFGIFGKRKLEKIEQYMLDYIAVKMESIRSDSDKMMLLSYINNKLDIVQFYIDILSDPETSKKYRVPHTMSQLTAIKDQLQVYRDAVLRFRVPPKLPDIYVTYPKGYEG